MGLQAIKIVTRRNQLQTIYSESSNLSNKTFKDILQKETSLTTSRGSRVAGRGSKVAVGGPMSRSRVQSRGRGRGSNVAAGENDLEIEVTE